MRHSKDTKLNSEGKKLYELIEEIGGVILNGRTIDDMYGEYTLLGRRGNSVIDYAICSKSFLYYIKKFSITSQSFSDHLPLPSSGDDGISYKFYK